MSARRLWTDADIARLRAAYRAVPLAELARELGRSVNAIKQVACRLGIAYRHAPKPKASPLDRPAGWLRAAGFRIDTRPARSPAERRIAQGGPVMQAAREAIALANHPTQEPARGQRQ